MGYKIPLNHLERKLREVIALGYGNTVHLTINGEEYQIVNTDAEKKKTRS